MYLTFALEFNDQIDLFVTSLDVLIVILIYATVDSTAYVYTYTKGRFLNEKKKFEKLQ